MSKLKETLVKAVAKDFFATTEKPNASKLLKVLDKHLSFPTFTEVENGKYNITIGKGKDKTVVKVNPTPPAPKKADAIATSSDEHQA